MPTPQLGNTLQASWWPFSTESLFRSMIHTWVFRCFLGPGFEATCTARGLLRSNHPQEIASNRHAEWRVSERQERPDTLSGSNGSPHQTPKNITQSSTMWLPCSPVVFRNVGSNPTARHPTWPTGRPSNLRDFPRGKRLNEPESTEISMLAKRDLKGSQKKGVPFFVRGHIFKRCLGGFPRTRHPKKETQDGDADPNPSRSNRKEKLAPLPPPAPGKRKRNRPRPGPVASRNLTFGGSRPVGCEGLGD